MGEEDYTWGKEEFERAIAEEERLLSLNAFIKPKTRSTLCLKCKHSPFVRRSECLRMARARQTLNVRSKYTRFRSTSKAPSPLSAPNFLKHPPAGTRTLPQRNQRVCTCGIGVPGTRLGKEGAVTDQVSPNTTASDERRHAFFILDNALIDDHSLTPHEGWLYAVIVRHVNYQTNVAFPSHNTLARKSGMS